MPDSKQTDDSDQLLVNLLDEYMEALEHGERPDREKLIAQYPEIADGLRDALMSLEFVTNAASGEQHSERMPKPTAKIDLQRQLLGDYQIVREIGRGGMAVVYEAEQLSLGRRVALKVLPFVSVLDPRQLARFKNEAQAAALLTHQNIVPVYSVGCERSVHFFAMQYIDGQSLAEFIQQMRIQQPGSRKQPAIQPSILARSTEHRDHPGSGIGSRKDHDGQVEPGDETLIAGDLSTHRPNRWPVYCQTVAKLTIQACDALDYAHRQGILHRDIKPGNLMLDTAGNLWVADFGLARIENDLALTMTGDILGTLRYMSPEQAMAKRPLIDHRSDIYSLGATLFEMLTLEPAIEGQHREEVINRIAFDEPRSPRRLNSSIPRELDTIVCKAMAKHPADRYQTAESMADDLHRFLDDKPILAKPPTIVHRLRKWTRRHKVFAGTAFAGLMVSLLVALLGLVYSNHWIDKERRGALASEKLRREQLVDTLIQRSAALRRTDVAGRRKLALNTIGQAMGLTGSLDNSEERTRRIRNEAIACLATTDLNETRFLPNPITYWVDFDENLERYSNSDEQNNINIWLASDNSKLLQLPGDGPRIITSLFSPNGQFLVSIDEADRCKVWDLNRETVIYRSSVYRATVDFSSDSARIAIGQQDGSIRIFDLKSKQVIQTQSPGVVPQAIRFSPDGKRLAVCGYGTTRVQIRDLESNTIVEELDDHLDYLGDVGWSPDGKNIAVGCLDGRIYLWDLGRRKVHAILRHQLQVIRVRFSPDGDHLASAGHDGSTRLWRTDSGQLLATAKGHFVNFDSTGRSLSFQNKAGVGIWRLTSDGSLRILSSKWDPNEAWFVNFDPSGQLLASAGPHGAVLWDGPTGKELSTIPIGGCGAVEFDSPGTNMFTASFTGLYRWPINRNEDSNLISYGPPSWVADLPGYSPKICLSSNDQRIAFVDGRDSVKVLNLRETDNSSHLKGHADVHFVSLSSDGRWAVTCAKPGKNVMVWNMETGKSVATFFDGYDNAPAFSPDNKWLATVSNNEYRIYEVGTWELRRQIPLTQSRLGAITFSPDSSTVAFYQSPGLIHLIDTVTGKPIGILEPPEPNIVSWLKFNADGSSLAIAAADRIHVWHFRHLCEQLRRINIEWQLPFVDSSPPAYIDAKPPPQLVVNYGDTTDKLNHPGYRAPVTTRQKLLNFLNRLKVSLPLKR